MNMNQERFSPITGKKEQASFGPIGTLMGASFKSEESHYCLTERVLMTWMEGYPVPYQSYNTPMFSHEDGMRLRALFRSYAWRAVESRRINKIPILTMPEDYEQWVKMLTEQGLLKYYAVYSTDMLIAEANTLTFESRCLKTLENLIWFQEHQLPSGTDSVQFWECPYIKFNATKPYFRADSGVIEEGLTFATPNLQCHYVYEYLTQEGYLEWMWRSEMRVTAKGYAKLDEIRAGQAGSNEVFVITRYDDLTPFLDAVFVEVGEKLKLKIGPVWKEEHNDRIDERIFRKLNESVAVILNVNSQNFNVGLEAGYSIAIRKPIVSIRSKPIPDENGKTESLPFDIITLNTTDFEEDKREDFVQRLVARLEVAISNSQPPA